MKFPSGECQNTSLLINQLVQVIWLGPARYRNQCWPSHNGFNIQHDDVIEWEHFPRYWSLVRGIHRRLVNSLHKGPVTRGFNVVFDLCLNKQFSKQSRRRWFETPSRPLWRHCNESTTKFHRISSAILNYVIRSTKVIRNHRYSK